jgi:hypothetical protein
MTVAMRVISLGAGVQSTTMALMAAHGEITPMPDCAIFADTGAEPRAVYDHLQWLTSELPFPVHVVTAGDLWTAVTAIKRTKDGLRTYTETAIPVFTKGDEKNGLGKRACTRNFKIDPVNRKIRELVGKKAIYKKDGIVAEVWMGISLDEAMRMKPNAKPYLKSRFPLLEKNITRKMCLEWMEEKGYQRPPRSACTFCPYHSDFEWMALTKEDFADAVLKERELQAAYIATTAIETTPFFHRSRVPLDQVIFDPKPIPDRAWQMDMFINECEGMCGV